MATGTTDAIMLDNADWLTKLNYIEMLRDVGRHFSVNRMLTMDSVSIRLEREQEMSFIEFNYMVLPGVRLRRTGKRENCLLQMGGSDQWGNIINGVDLGRRMGTHQLYALTTPLLTTVIGREDGQDRPRRRLAQRRSVQPIRFLAILAQRRGCRRRQVPQAVHDPADGRDRAAGRARRRRDQRGQEGARDRSDGASAWTGRRALAAETARKTFEEGAAAATLPTVRISAEEFKHGVGILQAFVAVNLVASNGEARRQIKGGGLRVNDAVVTDDAMKLTPLDLNPEGAIKLSLGRKKHVLLRPE